jgi:hypothetical protein
MTAKHHSSKGADTKPRAPHKRRNPAQPEAPPADPPRKRGRFPDDFEIGLGNSGIAGYAAPVPPDEPEIHRTPKVRRIEE